MQNEYMKSLELWEQNEYEQTLNIWKECLENNQYVDEIVTNIQEAFLEPNQEEVVAVLQKNWKIFFNENISEQESWEKYQQFDIRYLCYADGKYYVFDEKNKLLLQTLNLQEQTFENTFDDVLIMYPQTVTDIVRNFSKRYPHRIYCIGEVKEEFDSIYCIPELPDVLEEKIIYFRDCSEEKKYFLKNKAAYIPKNIQGYGDEKIVDELMQTFKEVHDMRLKKEYRDNSNVLLSIGIPTYNRGVRALQNVLSILPSLYDAEIEIVVSDNGSTVQMEEYKQIAELQDARIKYYKAPKNLGFQANVWKVMELSSGKYVLLLSDEDQVILEQLGHYLTILKNQRNLGLLRASRMGEGNPIQYETSFYNSGIEAFEHVFLDNNYMSGGIYRNNGVTQNILKELSVQYRDNEAFILYPHMCFDAKIAEIYDVCEDEVYLIGLGRAAVQRASLLELEYTKIENRIKQHIGWREFLDDQEELPASTKYTAYLMACHKLFYLVRLVKECYEAEWEENLNKLAESCAREYDNLHFLNEKQKEKNRDGFVKYILQLYSKYMNK